MELTYGIGKKFNLMKQMNSFWIIFIFLCFKIGILNAQTKKDITYLVKEQEIYMCITNPVADFTVLTTNSTKNNFIMYGFRNASLVAPSIDSLFITNNIKNSGSGNGFYLLKEDWKRADVWPNVPSPHDDLYAQNDLESLKNKMRIRNIEKMEVLKANSSKETVLKIDLSDSGPLEKGNYWFYLIYSSGDLVRNFVGSDQTEDDTKKEKALIFNDFIVSNRVRLIIK